jgi:hypothetical protein
MAEDKTKDTPAADAASTTRRAQPSSRVTETTPDPVDDAGYRGEGVEKADAAEGQAVVSVTTEVPHEADATSAPGPYADLPIDRPPVSTSNPQQPIAHSLIAGAGAGNQGQPEIPPERRRPENTEGV